MIPVKICGMTNTEDALAAFENGAAAVGFIFYPPSPRSIEPQKARAVIDALPAELVKVGVFVNEETDTIKKVFDDCRLDMIQLHGDESPEACLRFPRDRVIKALELKDEVDLKKAAAYPVAAILVDSRHAGLYGGTGKTSNWDMARRVCRPLILSGGLNENNIEEATRIVRPAALDVNSGVESFPGKKDHAKIARVMQIIQAQDAAGAAPALFTRREKP